MKRTATPDPLVTELINHCFKSDVPIEQRQAQLKALRQESPMLAEVIDHAKTHHSLPARPQDETFATSAPKLAG